MKQTVRGSWEEDTFKTLSLPSKMKETGGVQSSFSSGSNPGSPTGYHVTLAS